MMKINQNLKNLEKWNWHLRIFIMDLISLQCNQLEWAKHKLANTQKVQGNQTYNSKQTRQ